VSNVVCIEPTRFENVRDGGVSYGYRAYDDHVQTYANHWESIPDDDLQFLAMAVLDADVVLDAMLQYLQETEKGLYIGPQYYDWCEIKHLFPAADKLPEGVGAVCENCEKPCAYDPDMCLCDDCETKEQEN
jgi:hypothetical protein